MHYKSIRPLIAHMITEAASSAVMPVKAAASSAARPVKAAASSAVMAGAALAFTAAAAFTGTLAWTGSGIVMGAEAADEAGTVGETEAAGAAEQVQVDWWICPTGGFSDESKVQELVDLFEKTNPGVNVEFKILDAEKGDDEILASFGTEDAPDVVLAAPENIVTQWGGEGHMADLTSLWDEESQKEYRAEMSETAVSRDGVWYAVPLYRDVYTMAINYDMFFEANALQYLSEEVHSWKDNGFIDCVLRIHDYLEQEGAESCVAGKVYCKDETGQREFLSFVRNFFNTGVVDDLHSTYQCSKGNVRDVFGILRRLLGKGIEYDIDMDGNDENEAFLNGDIFLTFNWNAQNQKEAQEKADFRIFPMMYPNSKNLPVLTGTVGSLGVVEQEDQAKKDAAIAFVSYLMKDEEAYTSAVVTSGCFPARKKIAGHEIADLYSGDETMKLYGAFNEYYGDYYPNMELFDKFEEKWLPFLQGYVQGGKIKAPLTDIDNSLNSELEEVYHITAIEVEEAE